jgi:hypothetical protein
MAIGQHVICGVLPLPKIRVYYETAVKKNR